MASKKITVTLMDAYQESNKEYLVDIVADELGIYIRPHGYSDCGSVDGYGFPIMLEIVDGKPTLVLWRDINKEDPTEHLGFEGAREDAREIEYQENKENNAPND